MQLLELADDAIGRTEPYATFADKLVRQVPLQRGFPFDG